MLLPPWPRFDSWVWDEPTQWGFHASMHSQCLSQAWIKMGGVNLEGHPELCVDQLFKVATLNGRSQKREIYLLSLMFF